jgi:hypothetical protein
MLKKSKKEHDYIVPVDPKLSDFYKSAYPVTRIEDPEVIRAVSESPFVIASVERAKALLAKYPPPKDNKPKKGK